LEDNIKTNSKVIGCEDVDWIYLAQDRDQCQAAVKMVMMLCIPRQILHHGI